MKVKCITHGWKFLTYGKEYHVVRREGDKYYIYDDDDDSTFLNDDECEVIDEVTQKSTQEPTREFEVGDKVKIVKKVETEPEIVNWVPEMNMTIGYTGVVNDINHKAMAVKLEIGGCWWYPEESLELIEEAKQDKIKEELVQCNEAFENYINYPTPVIVNAPLVDYITYQQFIDTFDDKNVYVTISKGSVVIDIEGDDVYQQFECTTKQREQEVMKALIVLYGKNTKEKIND
jgi:ribosomal protein L21E